MITLIYFKGLNHNLYDMLKGLSICELTTVQKSNFFFRFFAKTLFSVGGPHIHGNHIIILMRN